MFIASQVLVVVAYVFIALSYAVKDRKKLLLFCIVACCWFVVAYSLMEAWSAAAVNGICVVRNIAFLFNKKPSEKKFNTIIFVSTIVASLAVLILTYDGFWSTFAILGMIFSSISVYQKNYTAYKVFGVLNSSCWIAYNCFVANTFGIILESILLAYIVLEIIILKKHRRT
ncbi:MAG: YgjV family protein [Clostridiales bacterium]|nr:YgjV family protein [Clostridiales bacterium]